MESMKDILAKLPSQTEASFWLIVVVFLGTMVLGITEGSSAFALWPIMLSLLVLPVRGVLTAARREVGRQDGTARTELAELGVLATVQAEISALAERVEITRPVHLIISPLPHEIRTFGTWRRHYVMLGKTIAQRVAHDLRHPQHREQAQTLLLHELAHIANKDTSRISYTRSLLRTCVTVVPWWVAFMSSAVLAGWMILDALLNLDYTSVALPVALLEISPFYNISPAEHAEVSALFETVSVGLLVNFIVAAFLPMILTGGVLWLVYWRHMVRVQEFYADQFAVRWIGRHEVVLAAMARYRTRPGTPPNPTLRDRLNHLGRQLTLIAQPQPLGLYSEPLRGPFARVRRLLALHPTYDERVACLKDPSSIHANWKRTAWAVAILTLALNIILTSPLSGTYFLGYPIHFATLAIFVMLSTWLLPSIVQTQSFKKPLAKILLIVFGVRWGWLAFNVGMIVLLALLAPVATTDALMLQGQMLVGVSSFTPADLLAALPAYLFLEGIQIVVVSGLLGAYYLWQKHVLTMPQPNWRQRHWRGVAGLCVVTVALFLTPLTDIVHGDFLSVISPGRVAGYALGLLCLAALLYSNYTQRRTG